MVLESSSLLSPKTQMGYSRYQSGINPNEHQVSKIPGGSCLSNSGWNRLPSPTLKFPTGIYISPNISNSKVPGQTQKIDVQGNSCNTILAEEALFHNHSTAEYGGPITSSSDTGSALTRPVSALSTRKTTPDGIEIERVRLLNQGCSFKVVATQH